MSEYLSRGMHWVTKIAGATATGGLVTIAVAVTVVIGIVVRFSEPWQAAVHSTCGLIAVLMLFVLHHTETQQTNAILLKLDELIHADDEAHDDVMESETAEVSEQEHLRDRLHRDGEADR